VTTTVGYDDFVDGSFRMKERAFPMKASSPSRLAPLAPPDFNFRQRVSFDHFFFFFINLVRTRINPVSSQLFIPNP
jgi:hypothetical protein